MAFWMMKYNYLLELVNLSQCAMPKKISFDNLTKGKIQMGLNSTSDLGLSLFKLVVGSPTVVKNIRLEISIDSAHTV